MKKDDFKQCHQSGFCDRARKRAESVISGDMNNEWNVVKGSIHTRKDGSVSFKISKDSSSHLQAQMSFVEDGRTVRLTIDEPGRDRYRIPDGDVISKDIWPADGCQEVLPSSNDKKVYIVNGIAAHIQFNPFGLTVWRDDELLIDINGMGLFHVDMSQDAVEDVVLEEEDEDSEELHMFKKNNMNHASRDIDHWFGSHEDTMPRGRQSLSCDITLGRTTHLFGLPEHASSLSLKSSMVLTERADGRFNITFPSEPYRLFNLDVFEYELDSPMALYGAVPFLLGQESGIFWNNPSETWIEIIEQFEAERRTAVFSNESGIIDVFFYFGPPKDQLNLYAQTTGYPALPPLWSLGYHQCRWNYNSEEDLLDVHDKFDEYGIPLDTLWLDIEHTDGKRYFTWNEEKFPDPIGMQQKLKEHGRHLTTIVDPHIKVDEEYRVYDELVNQNMAVSTLDGKPFKGHCWPGNIKCIIVSNTPSVFRYLFLGRLC